MYMYIRIYMYIIMQFGMFCGVDTCTCSWRCVQVSGDMMKCSSVGGVALLRIKSICVHFNSRNHFITSQEISEFQVLKTVRLLIMSRLRIYMYHNACYIFLLP